MCRLTLLSVQLKNFSHCNSVYVSVAYFVSIFLTLIFSSNETWLEISRKNRRSRSIKERERMLIPNSIITNVFLQEETVFPLISRMVGNFHLRLWEQICQLVQKCLFLLTKVLSQNVLKELFKKNPKILFLAAVLSH